MTSSDLGRLLCGLFLLTSSAFGQSPWTVTTADFKTQSVQLRAVGAQGVTVVPEASKQEIQVPWDNLLQVQRAAAALPPASALVLQLANGDRLAGQPVAYADEQLQWQEPLLGQMRLPLKEARALWRGAQRSVRMEQTNTEDVISLSNGDIIKGLVTSITDRAVTVNTANGDVPAPLSNVQWISFAAAGKPPRSTQRQWRLSLIDGSLLTVNSVEVTGEKVTASVGAASPRQLALAAVNAIEQINGPVAWLSSQVPTTAVHRPFFGSLSYPAVMDATVNNHPIQFGGRTFQRGIGVHAYSRLDYALDGSYRAFRTQYAIASDVANQYADLVVRVRVDDQVVYAQEHVAASKLYALSIELPAQARQLSLEVDYGAGHGVQGHLNWIEPALLRALPAEAAASANKEP